MSRNPGFATEKIKAKLRGLLLETNRFSKYPLVNLGYEDKKGRPKKVIGRMHERFGNKIRKVLNPPEKIDLKESRKTLEEFLNEKKRGCVFGG